MAQLLQLAQLSVAALSIPAVTATVAWLARRFSKESRLLLRVERLARIYPSLPDGPSKTEYALRVHDAMSALNRWLDPLVVLERRRKRVVVAALTPVVCVVGYALSLSSNPQPGATLTGTVFGGVAVGAFLLIEHSTKVQRSSSGRGGSGEIVESTVIPAGGRSSSTTEFSNGGS